jgi:phosphoribosyl-ATP pyrophosphohydrolase
MSSVLFNLIKIIKKRKKTKSNNSYTYFLFKKGKMFILKKLKEEALELLFAFKGNNKKNIIHETADLIYHLLVMLEIKNIKIDNILKELVKRQKISGIQEKKNRKKNVR